MSAVLFVRGVDIAGERWTNEGKTARMCPLAGLAREGCGEFRVRENQTLALEELRRRRIEYLEDLCFALPLTSAKRASTHFDFLSGRRARLSTRNARRHSRGARHTLKGVLKGDRVKAVIYTHRKKHKQNKQLVKGRDPSIQHEWESSVHASIPGHSSAWFRADRVGQKIAKSH